MNEEKFARFQKEGTGDILGDIRALKMNSIQRVMDLLDRIEYEYQYDAGASYGTLTESEVRYRYDLLLNSLGSIPGITESDKSYLTTQIQEKISDIPRTELAQINSFLKNDESVHRVVLEISSEQGISYDEAKKLLLSQMKERADRYNKMIEDENKDKTSHDGEEPNNGGESRE